MADEAEVAAVEQGQPEVDEAAFEAAFTSARGDTPPAQEAQPEPEAKADAEEPPAEEAKPEEPQRNEYGYTAEEMKELLTAAARVKDLERKYEEQIQKVHGKLGDAFRNLQSLKDQRSAHGVEITLDDLDSELREQFPEMAQMQLKSLQKVLAKAYGAVPAQPATQPQQPAFDPSVVDERVTSAKTEMEQKVEKRLLKRDHPDWEQVVATQEFKTWFGAQPDDFRNLFNSSWDADFLSDGLRKFKDWRTQQQKTSTKKTARLEQAVVPQGTAHNGPPALDTEAAFLSGFSRWRG